MTQLVGATVAAEAQQLAAPPLPAKAAPAASGGASGHATSAEAILARNPFDSVTGPLNKQPVAEEPSTIAPPPEITDPMSAPLCEGVKVLVIAASGDPDWSLATFSGGGEGSKTLMRRRGGDVNGKTVKFIGWDRVWLTQGSSLCQATMFNTTPPPPAAAPVASAPPPAAHSGGASSVPPDIAKGVQKVSANEFNIDRGVVDKILENQAELMRQARIVPEQENGKTVGIRLFGVRPDSLLGTLGMENGDRLEKINGFDMASPEKALEAYARLRTADHLTVQITRRGQQQNLDFNIK
jgi:general secretion pathway protein C